MAVIAPSRPALTDRASQARWARGPRARALLADLILISILGLIINSIYGVTQIPSSFPPHMVFGAPQPVSTAFSTEVAWPWLLILWLAYWTVPEAFFGATPGKLWVGLRVVRVDGRPLGVSEVVARNVMRLIDALPTLFLVGGIAVLASDKTQRLGDMVAGTTVVARVHAADPGATRTASPRITRIVAAIVALLALETIAFNYFARPPLVVAGMFNQPFDVPAHWVSYTLGRPVWTPDLITYPVTVVTDNPRQACTGEIHLEWLWFGWGPGAVSYHCTLQG